ncbi:MAG: DUF456 domain-containing protein [Thermodesulfovibrionales bacterium]
MTDTLLVVISGGFMLAGLIGCLVPVLPGPPMSYVGLLLMHFAVRYSFSMRALLIYGVLVIVVTALDYLIPVYWVRRMEGSRGGMIGCAVGLVVGVFLGLPGIILGPLIGAFVGELATGRRPAGALRSAGASAAGLLAGTGMKVALSLVMAFHFISKLLWT